MTVAVVAYNRPAYLAAACDALAACDEFTDHIDNIVCSVDDATGGGAKCLAQLYGWGSKMSEKGIEVYLRSQHSRRGIVGNTVLAMKMAFDIGAENVLMLEDDAVLKPDALRLAKWWCDQNFEHCLAFSLGAHAMERPTEEPQFIGEFNRITCPFGYVVNKRHWPFLLKNWCRKEYRPCGWSWSMTFAARFSGLLFMSPYLSRCENIGRESGTNETPETWDKTQRNIKFSDGSYRGPYAMYNHLSNEEIRAVDDWMFSEINKVVKDRYPGPHPGWLGFGCPKEIIEARELLCVL